MARCREDEVDPGSRDGEDLHGEGHSQENELNERPICTDFLRYNKKLLGAPGLTTRSKGATRGSWPCY